jgi:gliding motility-associated-like protein
MFARSKKFIYWLLFLVVFTANSSFGQNSAGLSINKLEANFKTQIGNVRKGSFFVNFSAPSDKLIDIKYRVRTSLTDTNTPWSITKAMIQPSKAPVEVGSSLDIADKFYEFQLQYTDAAGVQSTSPSVFSLPIYFKNEDLGIGTLQYGLYQTNFINYTATVNLFEFECAALPNCKPYIENKNQNNIVTNKTDKFDLNDFLSKETRKCGDKISYQFRIFDKNNIEIISDVVTHTFNNSKNTPPALNPNNIHVSIQNNEAVIFWQNSASINPVGYVNEKEHFIEKKVGNGSFTPLNTGTSLIEDPLKNKVDQTFTDNTFDVTKGQHFYRIRYKDYCDNFSDYSPAEMIFLEVKNTNVNWSNYYDNQKISGYFIEFYDDQLIYLPGRDITANFNNSFTLSSITPNLRIRAESRFTGKKIYSNFGGTSGDIIGIFPSVFSPNNDNFNDYFKVTTQNTKEFNLRIFDRSGQLVYESKNYGEHASSKGWDGKSLDKGHDMPIGSYFINIVSENRVGKKFNQKGVVMLVR